MKFKKPLTKAELKEIQGRYQAGRDDPDAHNVRALLWEVARLRALVLRADQLQRSMGELVGGGVGSIVAALRRELEEEPCVQEQPQLPELRGQPRL